MPIPGLDPAPCRARNRRAANLGINSAPINLYTRQPGPIDTGDPTANAGLRVITAKGKLPATPAAAVERINRILGGPDEPLKESDVWIVYLEAGNSNFIRKLSFHLGDTTLRNIAQKAQRGFAFMNSHRTGGMSTDAELPYGRTFAGRFEQAQASDGRSFSRCVLGVYMLRGQAPNGANGPTTDALYAGIKGGTIFDVSLGLNPQVGDLVCDVCGNDLEMRDDDGDPVCPHVPGTHHAMDDDEIKAQARRGVTDGVATFTFENGTASEVSPVYDGAVPGAGFRKALSLCSRLSASELEEARTAFAPLVGRGTFRTRNSPARPDTLSTPRGTIMAKGTTLGNLPPGITINDAFRFWRAAGEPDNIDFSQLTAAAPATPASPAVPAQAPAQPATPVAPTTITLSNAGAVTRHAAQYQDPATAALAEQVEQLQRQLDTERSANLQRDETNRRETFKANGIAWAQTQLRLGLVNPSEAETWASLHAQAAYDDFLSPAPVAYRDATDTPQVGSRVAALSSTLAKRAPHGFTREVVTGLDGNPAAPAAPAAPGAAATPAAPQPLFNLGNAAAGPARGTDQLGSRMDEDARTWAKRQNGPAHANGST